MMMMGGPGPQPWAIAEELKRDFDMREVPMGSVDIPPEVDVLFVIHPKDITPEGEFGLDQFVLRGGRLVVFLDPMCLFDGGSGQIPQPSISNLPTLLPAWGLSFDSTQAVADLTFEGRTRDGRNPWLLDLHGPALDPGDVLTADAGELLLGMAGAFSGNGTETLTIETLVRSSADSQLVDPYSARMSPGLVVQNFVASGREMPLALRISGNFTTAFPSGKPGGDGAPPPLQSSQRETTVILVGDADMLADPLAVSEVRGPFPGGRLLVPANGNLGFAQSAAEQLAGDPALISVRGRAVTSRPFTVVRQMQASAEQKYLATIRELETSLQETQSRLANLERGKVEGQKFLLTPEQQKEIESFRRTEAEVKKKLKETRRELRAEIDALEVRLKWLNIAAVPACVALAGLGFGLWRRVHARAR
jgi:ABC-type uncharacterized transport system involved in gliding motility auxiliary subunit